MTDSNKDSGLSKSQHVDSSVAGLKTSGVNNIFSLLVGILLCIFLVEIRKLLNPPITVISSG